MIKLKTLEPHDNEYGGDREKKKGSTYEAPDQVAQSLIANGYAEAVDPPKSTR